MDINNDKYLSDKVARSKVTLVFKKKKGQDIPNSIAINFKFDDFEPITNKYQSFNKKQHGKIYYDNVDILDQNRFKFILNLSDKGGGKVKNSKNNDNSIHYTNSLNYLHNNPNIYSKNYSKYSTQINSSLKWEDINVVIYYSVNVYICPICLEKKLACPVITRCGHIFCWPCIYNYHDYWTKSALNSKIPKCPLCQEKINLSQIKFCEILHCVNYLSSHDSDFEKFKDEKPILEKTYNPHINNSSFHTNYIAFNLIMKNQKAPTLYNTFCDPDLEYYKKHLNQKDAFNFIPLENQEEFSFSRIFLANPTLMFKRYNELQKSLEETLNDELSLYADERKIMCLKECINIINNKIEILKKKIYKNKEDQDEASNEIENDGEGDGDSINNINSENNSSSNKQNSEDINDNISTIDEDLKNVKLDLNLNSNNFLYFYQEQYGDIYFLHPINYSILFYEYATEERLPTEISGKILEIEMHQISPYLKNKYPFLNHLKIGSLVFFVEVEMKQIVSNHTMKHFHNILKDRAKVRNSIKKEEKNYDNYVQNIKYKEEIKLSSELIQSSAYNNIKIRDVFKDDSTFLIEEDLNLERKESLNSDLQNTISKNITERKENKLKILLEKTSDEIEKEKNKYNKKFIFSVEEFPDIVDEKKKAKLKINPNNYNGEIEEDINETYDASGHNELDDGFTIVKPKRFKDTNNNAKAGKKKKKFAELNSDIMKEIENKQFNIENLEDNNENALIKNLIVDKSKNKPGLFKKKNIKEKK